MKKRFLSIMLAAALAFGGAFATPATAATTAEAATVPDTMPTDIKAMVKDISDEELVELLDLARAQVGDANYEKSYTEEAAMLRNDCTFLTGTGLVNETSSNGGWILWLNQAEEEILRQRFPDILANVPSPIALDAGYDGEDSYMNENQVKPSATSEFTIAPDFAKIIKILERGPYTVSHTSSLATNCTGTVKVNKTYKITADFQIIASDGGDFDVDYIELSLTYNRKKPTKLEACIGLAYLDQTVEKTFTLKIPKSLQKKIKAGKVKFTGANPYEKGNETTISVYQDKPSKDGKLNLNFKFKTVK